METIYKIVPYKDGRFAIVDIETGEMMDDARGYGYKTFQNANRAAWYKFKSGKVKITSTKLDYKKWLKEHDGIQDDVNELFEIYFKEIASGEMDANDIITKLENSWKMEIPNKFGNLLLNS
jgi:hypothetical protein